MMGTYFRLHVISWLPLVIGCLKEDCQPVCKIQIPVYDNMFEIRPATTNCAVLDHCVSSRIYQNFKPAVYQAALIKWHVHRMHSGICQHPSHAFVANFF